MFANLLAEAGLSECSRAGTECPGFGVGPLEIAIVGILAIALLMVPASATVSILSWKPPARERMSWLVAVWAIPVVGGVLWFIYAGASSSATHEVRTFD
ncbi:PLDc N-terminal domain-containing protein [Rhodococcus erythropolis]|uniref:PLDc N-terminal domain-containing protein n=1 Tax=Rhodococcus erythropolis TaxID=1833 RepID=UPI003981B50F